MCKQQLLLPVLVFAFGTFSHPLKRGDYHGGQLDSVSSYTLVSNDSGIWPYRSYMSSNATSPEFVIESNGKALGSGSIFLTLANTGLYGASGVKQQGAVIMSSDGDLVWAGPDGDTSNFRTQQYQNEPVVTTWTGNGAAAAGGGASHGYGQVDIINTKYETVKTVCPSPTALSITFPPGSSYSCVADIHESYITESNTILVTVYNITQADLSSVRGPKQGWITNSLAVEVDIDTNEPIFVWNPFDHVPLNASHNPLQGAGTNASNTWDWFHMNSIQSFNGGYLINSRQVWSSYFVNKQGEIEWEVKGETGGSFGSLPQGYNFSWEHDARLHTRSDSKLLYTNFNDYNGSPLGPQNPSSGIGFVLDVPSKTLEPAFNVKDASNNIYAFAEGSTETLDNGNVFVGFGVKPFMTEFGLDSPNGSDVRWTAQFAYNNLNNTASSYRAYKNEWHAVPTTSVDLVVMTSNVTSASMSGKTGYVSWNGATDVTSYAIYAKSPDCDDFVDTGYYFQKKGFETAFQVPKELGSLQVVALAGSAEQGRSQTVAV